MTTNISSVCGIVNMPVNGKGKTVLNNEPNRVATAQQVKEVFERVVELRHKSSKNINFEKIGTVSSPLLDVGEDMPYISQNSFVATLHEAFANERPLGFSPDHIWTLIIQGVAIHVAQNADALRGLFVSSDANEGKKKIEVRHDGLVLGRDSSWELVFPVFANLLNEEIVGGVVDMLPQFSTTTSNDQIIHVISLMDTVKSYFEYQVTTKCGVSRISLLGTAHDWQILFSKAEAMLKRAEMAWWWTELAPILQQFCNLSSGNPADLSFWMKIYDFSKGKGSGVSDTMTGWFNCFFPYQANAKGNVTFERRSTFSGAMKPTQFPASVGVVPFIWNYLGTPYKMEFFAGAIGIGLLQDGVTIVPSLSWFIVHE